MRARLVRELAGDGFPVTVTSPGARPAARHLLRQPDPAAVGSVPRRRGPDRRCHRGPHRIARHLRRPAGPRRTPTRARELLRPQADRPADDRRRAGRGLPPAQRPSNRPLPGPHEDLAHRQSTATGPDRLWCTDITEHPPAKGRSTAPRSSTSGPGGSSAGPSRTTSAPNSSSTPSAMATWQRRPSTATIVHSDRGSQYTTFDLRPPAARSRSARLGGPGRLLRGQRAHGILLVHDATGTARPSQLGHPDPTRRSDLRMDRGLLQPHPPALRHQLPLPGRLRDHEPGSGAHHRGNPPELSGKPGQAPVKLRCDGVGRVLLVRSVTDPGATARHPHSSASFQRAPAAAAAQAARGQVGRLRGLDGPGRHAGAPDLRLAPRR